MASIAIASGRLSSGSTGRITSRTCSRLSFENVIRLRRQQPPGGRRGFFGWARQQGQYQQHNHHQHHNYNKHGSSWNSRTFFEDPGLRWTATVSNPADVSGPEGIPGRSEQLQKLKDSHNQDDEDAGYDVLVIGGGATGAGIALDAANRGLKTACIERGDFASETSSRSTKLIWAGLKYLGTAVAGMLSPRKVWEKGLSESWHDFVGELTMVLHCHQERWYMTTRNRHLCTWIPIAVPFASWFLDPPPIQFPLFSAFPLIAPVAFKVYDSLSGFSCPPSYVLWSRKNIQNVFPQLDASQLVCCAVFYEAQHNDARTNLAIALTAAEKGADICNYVAATDLVKDPETGQATGAVVVDRMTNKSFVINAKHIVFAGGPFTDGLRRMEVASSSSSSDQPEENEKSWTMKPAVRGAHGSHVVLPGHLVPQHSDKQQGEHAAMGMLDCNTSDGRFLFILPWLGHTLIGTTDEKGVARTLPSAPESDVEWILHESSKYYRDDLKADFDVTNVTSSWRGWRPLAVDPHARPDAPASRDHVISQHPETKCFFIAGGKWTTWREMAQDLVDKLTTKPCTTLEVSLLGGEGYSDSLVDEVCAKYPTLERDIVQHLVNTYGGRVWHVCHLALNDDNKKRGLDRRLVPDFPYIEAEVVYACREYACNVEDVLSRRTRLAFLNRNAALYALPRVAQLMQQELHWSNKVTKNQIQAAQAYVESYGGARTRDESAQIAEQGQPLMVQ